MGAVDLHLGAFQADILDIADDADGEIDALDRDLSELLPPASIVAVTLSASFLAAPSPWRR